MKVFFALMPTKQGNSQLAVLRDIVRVHLGKDLNSTLPEIGYGYSSTSEEHLYLCNFELVGVTLYNILPALFEFINASGLPVEQNQITISSDGWKITMPLTQEIESVFHRIGTKFLGFNEKYSL